MEYAGSIGLMLLDEVAHMVGIMEKGMGTAMMGIE